jgi:hypothetical protein
MLKKARKSTRQADSVQARSGRHDVKDDGDNGQADHATEASGERRSHQGLVLLERVGELTVDVAADHPTGRPPSVIAIDKALITSF